MRKTKPTVNYWMSYADLMSAMLLLFALLLAFVMLDYREDLDEKQEQIEAVTSVRHEIIQALTQEFEDSDVGIEVDQQTGAIKFTNNILYEFDSYKLTKKGKKMLDDVIPKYFAILLQDQFQDEISNIIIEGHTDNDGSYLANLNLSQNRAFSVLEYIYSDEFKAFKEKELSKEYITANGRSNTVPVYDKNNKYSADKSRRVEFQFRLKEEERIEEIEKLVK